MSFLEDKSTNDLVQELKAKGFGILIEKFVNWRATVIDRATKQEFEGVGETDTDAVRAAYLNAVYSKLD